MRRIKTTHPQQKMVGRNTAKAALSVEISCVSLMPITVNIKFQTRPTNQPQQGMISKRSVLEA